MDTAPSPGETLTIVQVASGDLWAGAEVQVFHLARALLALPDINLHVVLLHEGELARRLRDAGVDVTVFDEDTLSTFTIYRRLCALLMRLRPDIVHTHRRKENVLGAFAAARVGARSLRTVHGAEEWVLGPLQVVKRVYRVLDTIAGRMQDRIVAVAPPLAERLRERFPVAKVVVVENGIDVEGVRAQARREVALPGPEGAVRAAFVGRLVPVKRLDLFLEAAARVARKRPGAVHFYVFGDGPLRDDVAARRSALGLEGVVALMGFVADLPPCLARMDLLLVPSDHEGLPMNVLEAMALGVPVVAHAVGGLTEVLAGGDAGTLVTGHAAGAYADAVLAYVDDPAPFRARAEAAGRRVAARYTVAGTAARYLALYGALAGGRSARPAVRRAAG